MTKKKGASAKPMTKVNASSKTSEPKNDDIKINKLNKKNKKK